MHTSAGTKAEEIHHLDRPVAKEPAQCNGIEAGQRNIGAEAVDQERAQRECNPSRQLRPHRRLVRCGSQSNTAVIWWMSTPSLITRRWASRARAQRARCECNPRVRSDVIAGSFAAAALNRTRP